MSAAIDTVGGGTSFNSNTITVSGYSTSGANELILLYVSTSGVNLYNVTSVSGGSLTWKGIGSVDNGSNVRIELWAAFATSTVTSATITVTISGSTNTDNSASVISFSGVRSTGTSPTACLANGKGTQGTSTSPSQSTAALSDNGLFVYGLAERGSPTVTAGAGQTKQQQNISGGGSPDTLSIITQNSLGTRSATVTNSATLSSSQNWLMLGVEVLGTDSGMVFGGKNFSNTNQTTQTTIAGTVTGNGIPSGSQIIVTAGNNGGASVSSISDTVSNTYIQASSNFHAGLEVWIVKNSAALSAGDTITVTFSGAVQLKLLQVAVAFELDTSSPLDQNTSTTGTSTTPNSGNVTTTQTTELIIGAVAITNAGIVFTPTSPYSTYSDDFMNFDPSTRYETYSMWKYVTTTGTYSAGGTLGSSQAWNGLITTFKSVLVNSTTNQVQAGKGRITHTTPQTQTGKGDIAVFTPQTQPGKASVTNVIPTLPWASSPLMFNSGPLKQEAYTIEVRDQFGHLVAELKRPMQKHFTLYRNKSGSCQFVLDAYDPQAIPSILKEDVYDIVIRRKGTPVFAGQISYVDPQIDESDQATVTVTATGYLDLFIQRLVTVSYPFYDSLQNQLVFGATDGGGVIANILSYAQFPINADASVLMQAATPTLNQSFIAPGSGNVSTIKLLLQKNGSPSGNIVVGIYTDSSGVPGTLISNSQVNVAASSVGATQFEWTTITYGGPYPTLTVGTKYWIKAKLDTTQSGSNGIYWGYLNNDYYPSGKAYSPESPGLFTSTQDLKMFIKLADNSYVHIENAYWNIEQGGLTTSFSIQPNFSEFKKVKDIIDQITKLNNGIDFNIVVTIDGSNVMRKFWNVFYPKQGVDNTALNFSFPGNIIKSQKTKDGKTVINKLYTRGQGSGIFQTITTSINTTSIFTYAMRESNDDFSDVPDTATLQSIGDENVRVKSNPLELPALTVDGNKKPFVTDYGIGDTILVKSNGPGFLSFSAEYRIEQIDVQISDDGRETASLTVSAA